MTARPEPASLSGPEAGCLVVVRPDRPDVLAVLQARFQNDSAVQVVRDRREGERRAWWPTIGYPEQRRGSERRQQPAAWTPLGFVILRRFGAEPVPALTPEEMEATLRRMLEERRPGA